MVMIFGRQTYRSNMGSFRSRILTEEEKVPKEITPESLPEPMTWPSTGQAPSTTKDIPRAVRGLGRHREEKLRGIGFLRGTLGADLLLAVALKPRGETIFNVEFWTGPRQPERVAAVED